MSHRRWLIETLALLSLLAARVAAQEPAPPAAVREFPRLDAHLAITGQQAPGQLQTAVWVHPEYGVLSTIITVDPVGNRLVVYDLGGNVIDTHTIEAPGGLDVRYDFPLGGATPDIVVVNQRQEPGRLLVYRIDPEKRTLVRVDNEKIVTGVGNQCALYRSPKTDKFYVFVSSEGGTIAQFDLRDDGTGKVGGTGQAVATRQVPGPADALCADDERGRLLVAERARGVWQCGAEPDESAPGALLIKVGENDLNPEIDGLALYRLRRGRGYVLVASRAGDTVGVYERGTCKYLGSFQIERGQGLRGLAACGADLGLNRRQGLVLTTAQRAPGRRDLLGLTWENIAAACRLPPLARGAAWEPRQKDLVAPDPEKPEKPGPLEKPEKPKPRPPVVH